ncbi:MAG: hypothetical protein ABIH34_00510 [Nanoarchaeota archaeon]
MGEEMGVPSSDFDLLALNLNANPKSPRMLADLILSNDEYGHSWLMLQKRGIEELDHRHLLDLIKTLSLYGRMRFTVLSPEIDAVPQFDRIDELIADMHDKMNTHLPGDQTYVKPGVIGNATEQLQRLPKKLASYSPKQAIALMKLLTEYGNRAAGESPEPTHFLRPGYVAIEDQISLNEVN